MPKLCGPDRPKPGFPRWTICSFLSRGGTGQFRARPEVRPGDQNDMSRNAAAGRPRLSRIAAWHLFFEFNPQNLTLRLTIF